MITQVGNERLNKRGDIPSLNFYTINIFLGGGGEETDLSERRNCVGWPLR